MVILKPFSSYVLYTVCRKVEMKGRTTYSEVIFDDPFVIFRFEKIKYGIE